MRDLELERFRGADTAAVFAQAREALGEDVVVLRTIVHRDAVPDARVELLAATAEGVERFRRRLTADAVLPVERVRARRRPLVVALVGPAGAGKTAAVARLATHPHGFAGWRVGLVTLDSRRPGALEAIAAHAAAATVPLEVLYDAREVPAAMKRLGRCDVLLVDTPGHRPRGEEVARHTASLLELLRPDEVHLVVPASMRADVASLLRTRHAGVAPTHTLLSRLDEVPGDHGLVELARAVGLPVRWATDGDGPSDLRPAAPRVLASLGVGPTMPLPRLQAARDEIVAAATAQATPAVPAPPAPPALPLATPAPRRSGALLFPRRARG